jgi:hypothetical protein
MVPTAGMMVFSFLGVGLGIALFVVAADRRRFLARFELSQWRESYYLRALPNFLQALHDHGYSTAWPRKVNAVSAAWFRFRTRRLLKKQPATRRKAFLQQHITLFALLEVVRPYIDDYVMSEQVRIAGNKVLDMEDTIERDRLVLFLERAKAQREAFYQNLTRQDRQILAQMVARRLMPTLRMMHANYQEHGFVLLPAFTELRRMEEMTGSELVQELPVITEAGAARQRARGLV